MNHVIKRNSLKKYRLGAIAVLLISVSSVTVACQEKSNIESGNPSSAPSAANPTALKIGSLLPATGDLSAVGPPLINAVSLLVETVNQCGGVNGAPD